MEYEVDILYIQLHIQKINILYSFSLLKLLDLILGLGLVSNIIRFPSIFIPGICTVLSLDIHYFAKSPSEPVGTFESFRALLLSIALEVLLRKLSVLCPL